MLLLGFVSVATATDIARRKIYNWTTYTGILAAVATNGVGSLAVWLRLADQSAVARLGWLGVGHALFGLLVCGFIMLACFVLFRGVGGGDVKLLAMMGAFLGAERGLEALLWTFVIGGTVGLLVLVWQVGLLRLAKRALQQLFWLIRFGHWNPLTTDERAQLQPPLFLAPSALAAAVIVGFGWFG